MPPGFRVATAYVEVEPSLEGFDEKLEAELKSKDVQAKVKAAPDTTGFKEKLQAAVERDKTETKVKVGADTTVLDTKLNAAKTKLDGIAAKDAKPRIGLESGTFDEQADRAKVQLAELGAKDEHARVHLDDGDFKEKAAADKAAADSLGGGISGLIPHISLLTGVLGGATMALPAFGGALAAVGGGVGVMALALGGVKQALSDYSQSQAQAAQSNAQMAATAFSNAVAIQNAEQAITDAKRQAAQQQIASAESIRNAEQALADARRQAAQTAISDAEAVGNAEQSLANAEINEQRAQQDLTLARQEATRQLQELNDAQKDATLGVTDAQLALQEALLQQKQTNQNAMTTQLQRQEADLAVAKAQQALKEAQEKATNATTDATKANQLGVEGSKTVQDAKNSERLALQAVANAQQSLGDAVRRQANDQVQSAEAIAKAEQGLADAQRTAAQQQIASNEAVAKAVKNLQDTQTEQALQAQTSGNQAAKAFQKDMANMSQAGRDFVTQLISMRGEFKNLSQAVQTATLPGFTTFLREISPLIPAITSNLSHMGSTIGGQFANLGAFLGSGKIQGEIKSILDQGTNFIATLTPAIGRMGASLLDLWSKSGAASSGLAKGLGSIADGFAAMFKALAPASGAIGSILQTLGQAIGSLGAPLGQIIAALAQGLAPVLKALLPGFTALAQALGPLLAGAIRALSPVLTLVAQNVSTLAVALSPVIAKIGEILGKLGPQLTPLFEAMAKGFQQFVTALQPLFNILPQIVGAFGQLITAAAKPLTDLIIKMSPTMAKITDLFVKFLVAALQPLIPHMSEMSKLFGQILTALAPLLPPLAKLAEQILSALMSALTPILPALEKLISQLIIATVQAIIPMLPQIVQLAGQFGKLFQQLMPLLPPLIQISTLFLQLALKVLPPLMPILTGGIKIFADLISILVQTDTAILQLINWVVKMASEWKRWLGDIWNLIKQFWNDVSNAFRTATDWIYNTIWKGWIGNIKSAATGLWKDITGGARTFFNDIQQVFSGGVQALGSIWNTIENIFKTPVNFLIGTVYDNGIRTLWNDVVKAIGASSISLPNVATLAGGGVIPGYSPGRDTVPALLSPGEAVLVPEAVRAIGPDAINSINSTFGGGRKSSVGRYQGGGIIGAIGDIVGGVAGTINSTSWLTGFSLDPMKAVETVLDKVVSTNAHGDYAKMMTGIPTTLIHHLAEWAKANASLGSGDGAKAVAYAIAQLGKPYVWGATGPDSFDCSGLTMRAWESAGKEIGRTTYDQINAGRAGSQAQALPGDIHLPETGHVMMFVKPRSGGSDEMIHAPHTGTVVQYAPFRGGGWVRLIATPGGAAGGGGSSQSASAAQSFAQSQFGQFGWGADQMAPLIALWNQESNWQWNATNPSSGAYGIPQSLPADKMASAGADWRTNAFTQVRWGLGYIHDRYGSPSGAEAHELAYNWYDAGGYLPPGMSRVVNATGKPEAVLTPDQTQALIRLADALSRAGGSAPAQVTANFYGADPSSPEHLAAVKHALATAVGRY